MKVYFTFSRGYLKTVCILLFICFLVLSVSSVAESKIILENEEERCRYLGVTDAQNPIVKEITVDADNMYTEQMKKQGFKLYRYDGKTALLYIYRLKDSVVYLYMKDDKLIGKDTFR